MVHENKKLKFTSRNDRVKERWWS